MSAYSVYALASVALFCMGIHSAAVQRNLLRKVLALNVAGGGAFLFLIAVARRSPGEAPDPVPHAMVLTGIVVAVSVTAVAMALVRRIHASTGSARLPEEAVE